MKVKAKQAVWEDLSESYCLEYLQADSETILRQSRNCYLGLTHLNFLPASSRSKEKAKGVKEEISLKYIQI